MPSILFIDRIKLLSQNLVHSEHMHLIRLENGIHLLVAADLAFIFWDLEITLFDVFPDLFDDLWARELLMHPH